MKIVVRTAGADEARRAAAALGDVLNSALQRPEVRRNVALVEEIRRIVQWQVDGKTLSLTVDDQQGKLTVLARGMLQPILAGDVIKVVPALSVNQLKHIGLALHNYHDAHTTFPPPAILSAEGKPLLSWRVAILPHLEGEVNQELYRQFHLDEAWDSPHNRPLLAKMPEAYRCPISKAIEEYRTVYVAPRGGVTVFAGPEGVSIRRITDGTSKTIAVVEVDEAHAVPWTQPEDWQLDENTPAAGLGGHFEGRFHALFCDGSVHFLRLDRWFGPLQVIHRAGGEPINIPDN